MERVWISLNEQDVAVQPYYVISDQLHRRQVGLIPHGLNNQADELLDKVQQLFKLNQGETLHMLLRIGYAKKTPVFSKRLPLQAVCSKITE